MPTGTIGPHAAPAEARLSLVSIATRYGPAATSASLYRVTQEALANVFKHAKAANVKVSLEFSAEAVQLQVRDDGRGFDAATVTPGNGLVNMRSRAEELGGSFNLESADGQGSSVTVRIPF